MKSVADDLRAELREEMRQLSVDERIALALRLGEEGVERFRLAHGLERDDAVRTLERRRQAGRRPSKCMSELIG